MVPTRFFSRFAAAASLVLLLHGRAGAAQRDISPPGSVAFGTQVAVLPNGNIVATDPAGPTQSIGTVYLLAPDGSVISSFTGTSPNDQVGSGGIMVLASGNFVVVSPHWSNNGAADAGAVTWVDGNAGLNGVVSAENSLVGTSANDAVGYAEDPFIPPQDTIADYSIQPLANGNYYVLSPNWNNGAATQAGAVTFGSGTSGVSGAVSAANSLVGSHANDHVGSGGTWVLGNGAAVVLSPDFSSAIAASIGAATWLSPTQAPHGAISAGNSLVGISAGDQVGYGGVLVLSNDNYVVLSPNWSNAAASAAGAATWARGDATSSGIVSPANSLVGSNANDRVGEDYGIALPNGNYVLLSPDWNTVGATTWGNGSGGTTGAVSAANSLVGSSAGDGVALSVVPLPSGNYVVALPYWNDGNAQVGAVTWGDGAGGTAGTLSSSNSLVGSSAGDLIGYFGVFPLPNSAYVVTSPNWSNGAAAAAGAATYAQADGSTVGAVSAANSLVGSNPDDRVGLGGAVVLGSGDYVVPSSTWSNGAASQAGAVTWGSRTAGVTGAVSPANSLVGSSSGDAVGQFVLPLSNGTFLLSAPNWSGTAAHVGLVASYPGDAASVGPVSAANALTGSSADDHVGSSLRLLRNGDVLVLSPLWSNPATGAAQTGAATWISPAAPPRGVVSPANSFVGTFANDQIGSGVVTINGRHLSYSRPLSDGSFLLGALGWNSAAGGGGAIALIGGSYRFTGTVQPWNSVVLPLANEAASVTHDYDANRRQLVLGRPQENRVTLLSFDRIFCDGLE